LVVVAPATPADNKGLLKAAIRSDDPVVYMEHKAMWAETGPVGDEDAVDDDLVALGAARIARPGTDVTLVTWSRMVGVAEQAAASLGQSGPSVEVIDLRTLWPWDRTAVFDSVAKTGRLMVVQESVLVAGFGGEIVATIAERMAGALKAPPRRLGAPRVPTPYSRALEDQCRVSAEMIAETATTMV
jgi:pyruvate dehydrogenase E1 component beta subunit